MLSTNVSRETSLSFAAKYGMENASFSCCDIGLSRTVSAGRRNVAHLSDRGHDTCVASGTAVLIILGRQSQQ